VTDTPPNRLWPLALLGWLAAFPSTGREAAAQTTDTAHYTTEESRAASGAARSVARPLSAPLSAIERAVLRRRQRRDKT
jgi:hypothetical protein